MADVRRASRSLLLIAEALDRSRRPDPRAVNSDLSRIAAGLDNTSGPVKLKLMNTEPSRDEAADETTYYQEWLLTLPDGTRIQTSTDVGWGDEPSRIPHGDVVVDVCGHSMTVEEIIGFVISTGDGPVEDGDEVALDGDWCSRMAEAGHLG